MGLGRKGAGGADQELRMVSKEWSLAFCQRMPPRRTVICDRGAEAWFVGFRTSGDAVGRRRISPREGQERWTRRMTVTLECHAGREPGQACMDHQRRAGGEVERSLEGHAEGLCICLARPRGFYTGSTVSHGPNRMLGGEGLRRGPRMAGVGKAGARKAGSAQPAGGSRRRGAAMSWVGRPCRRHKRDATGRGRGEGSLYFDEHGRPFSWAVGPACETGMAREDAAR